jgi:hypothetical protein
MAIWSIYIVAIWYIVWLFGIILPGLVYCNKKNLATLVPTQQNISSRPCKGQLTFNFYVGIDAISADFAIFGKKSAFLFKPLLPMTQIAEVKLQYFGHFFGETYICTCPSKKGYINVPF